MAISSINSVTRSVAQTALNAFGGKGHTFTVKGDRAIKNIKWIGQYISSPENRLILGITALMSQPFIDALNKNVDEKTRKYSIARTVAKIIVGTTTGVIIRRGCIMAIDAFTTLPEKLTPEMRHKWLRQCLLPKVKNIDPEQLMQYKNALGTLLALGVMVFSNFGVDAPMTKWLTNKFAKRMGVDNEQSK